MEERVEQELIEDCQTFRSAIVDSSSIVSRVAAIQGMMMKTLGHSTAFHYTSIPHICLYWRET